LRNEYCFNIIVSAINTMEGEEKEDNGERKEGRKRGRRKRGRQEGRGEQEETRYA